jgi:hypothetical protein
VGGGIGCDPGPAVGFGVGLLFGAGVPNFTSGRSEGHIDSSEKLCEVLVKEKEIQ